MVSSTSLLALVLLLFGSLQVSLPPIGEDFSCNFPLKRLTEEYTKYNVDIDDMSCKAGIYFAIATVFPSSKVLKDGVKLSWGLSCTTGIPTFEETIFICPIKTSDHSSNNNRINHAHMYKCTSLYLNLIQPKSNPGMLDNVPSDNGYASPETLLPRSRVNSWSITSCIDSTICLDTLSVNLSLKDEMANELLQRSASRFLIRGEMESLLLNWGFFRSLLAILQWWGFNVTVIITNKWIFQNLDFKFPLTVSCIHFICSAVGAYIAIEIFKIKPLIEVDPEDRWRRIFPMSFVFCINIVLGNVSLRYIPVSFMQTIKSFTPTTTGMYGSVRLHSASATFQSTLLYVLLELYELN